MQSLVEHQTGMKKILIIHVTGFGYSGITSVIFNYCAFMNREGLKIDFVSPKQIPERLIHKFSDLGRIIELPDRKKRLLDYCRKLSELFKRNKYDVVHIHGNSGTMMIESSLARLSNISNIIVHCHSTVCTHPVLNKLMRPIMIHTADNLLCCSEKAGEWLYKKNNYQVINNAINTREFRFSEQIRSDMRKKLNINDEFVLGHIGHFTEQKNHLFLINLLEQLVKKTRNIKLLLVGEGPLLESVHQRVCSLSLEDYVIFAGKSDDPKSMYSAMDMFIFPSKWEGLGMVLIEAQASGLSCIASNTVPKESNITGNVKFIDCKNIEEWKRCIYDCFRFSDKNRNIVSDKNILKIQQYGYDIVTEAEKLKEIYIR